MLWEKKVRERGLGSWRWERLMVGVFPWAFPPGSPMWSPLPRTRKVREVLMPLAPSLLAPAPVKWTLPQFSPSWFQQPLLSLPLKPGSSEGACAPGQVHCTVLTSHLQLCKKPLNNPNLSAVFCGMLRNTVTSEQADDQAMWIAKEYYSGYA